MISELSVASSFTSPLVVDTSLPPLILAASVLSITLTEPAPAAANVVAPPEPPPPLAAKPMVPAMISAVESASSDTGPAAATVELSITASTVLAITFPATDAPTAPPVPPPDPPATEPEAPPARATIREWSSADSETAPPATTSGLLLIDASISFVTVFAETEPAPEKDVPPPWPPAPEPATPMAAVSISASETARRSTAPAE